MFRRNTSPEPHGYTPTETEIQAAAAHLNAGNQQPADELCARSGDFSRATAMRVIGYCIDDPND